MKKFYTAKNDLVFKTIMLTKQNILKRIIESIIEEPVSELKILNSELTVVNVKSKKRIVDIYIQIKNLYLNLELNSIPKEYTNNRNGGYLFNIYNEGVNRGDNYYTLMNKEFIGINLTYQDGDKIEEEYKLQTKDGREFITNFKIIEINMEKIAKKWYTLNEKEKEKYKYLYMLNLNKESLLKFVSKEDQVMKEYESELMKLNNNDEFRMHITDEEDALLIYNSDLEIAKRDGKKEGAKEIVKKMITEGLEIKDIEKFTGLSKEEITELK